MIENVLLLLILLLLLLIYKKINFNKSLNKVVKEENILENDNEPKYSINDLEDLDYLTEDQIIEYGIEDYKYFSENKKTNLLKDETSNLFKAVEKLRKDGIKRNEKMELVDFSTNMNRYKEFLNQSKFINKESIIFSLKLIKTENSSVDHHKMSFLIEFTNLIFSNGLTFEDLKIETDDYLFEGFSVDSIYFNIENLKKIHQSDFDEFEADIVFTLKDNKKKVLKHTFYDYRDIDTFNKWFKKFKYINHNVIDSEGCDYKRSNKNKSEYRIILNDLYQHINFISENYYNKSFGKYKEVIFKNYDYRSLLINEYSAYIDDSWQTNKRNFSYVGEGDVKKKEKVIDFNNMSDSELFKYTLDLYYEECNRFYIKPKIFKVIKYLDKLIEKKYPMAYLVKALLHLDGEIAIKDTVEAKRLLRKAYHLGLYKPSILVWNENKLDEKGI